MSVAMIDLFDDRGQCVYRFTAPAHMDTLVRLPYPITVAEIAVQAGWERGPKLPMTEQERQEEWFEWWTNE